MGRPVRVVRARMVTSANTAKVRVFVDWVAALFARSDLMHRKCCARMADGPARQPLPAERRETRAAEALVAAGRPPCPICGQPLDPDGHVCPRSNGHK